jgi:molybdate transport system substrate-binding protein
VRLLLLLLLALNISAAEVRVFAAASLGDAVVSIMAEYERRTGDRVILSVGASSTLARQIEQGAPADVFLSADEAKMDALQRKGLIDPATRRSVLSNKLAIVGDGIRGPRDLVGKKVALAEPSSVPAGIYAKAWLTRIGLWDQIAPNVIPTEHVRAALAAVRSGNADAAIVYVTDTPAVSYVVNDGPPISYPFAVVKHAENPHTARHFFSFVRSPFALRIFRKYGFLIR